MKIKNENGFTLIETMVALLLVATIFMVIPIGNQGSSHSELETAVDDIDRAIRFGVNESILQNKIIRIGITLDELPNKLTVESGPSENLPLPELVDLNKLNFKEKEEEEKKRKKFDQQFSTVAEFQNQAHLLPENVRVTGLATSYTKSIIESGTAYIYIYPTGEKDESIVFVGSDSEMGILTIPAFEPETSFNTQAFSEYELANLEDSLENVMKEEFSKWEKNQ